MAYKLKPNHPDICPVDGKFVNKHFKSGEVYDEIPDNEKHHFDEVDPSGAVISKGKPKKKGVSK